MFAWGFLAGWVSGIFFILITIVLVYASPREKRRGPWGDRP